MIVLVERELPFAGLYAIEHVLGSMFKQRPIRLRSLQFDIVRFGVQNTPQCLLQGGDVPEDLVNAKGRNMTNVLGETDERSIGEPAEAFEDEGSVLGRQRGLGDSFTFAQLKGQVQNEAIWRGNVGVESIGALAVRRLNESHRHAANFGVHCKENHFGQLTVCQQDSVESL